MEGIGLGLGLGLGLRGEKRVVCVFVVDFRAEAGVGRHPVLGWTGRREIRLRLEKVEEGKRIEAEMFETHLLSQNYLKRLKNTA